MLRTCPKARGFVLIDYLFATWLMSLLCFFILEAFSLGLWWTRTWEPGPTLKRSCVILPLQVRRLPFWIPICGWKQSESFLNCPRSRNGRQLSMNGLVGGFLPAWYAMKKIRALWPLNVCCSSFFPHSSSAFAQGPAGDLSRCHRSSYPAGNCAGQRWILTAALNIIFVMKHLLFPSKRELGDVLELWTRSPYQTIQYYAAPSPQSGRETLYISAQEGMKPPGINPLTGPHLRILDFHAENRKVTRLRFPVPLSLSKTGQGAPLRRSMPMDFGRRRGGVTGVSPCSHCGGRVPYHESCPESLFKMRKAALSLASGATHGPFLFLL